MTLNETRSQLSDTSGNLSTLTQTVKGINETVSKNYEDANSALVKLREDLDAKISETEKALVDGTSVLNYVTLATDIECNGAEE